MERLTGRLRRGMATGPVPFRAWRRISHPTKSAISRGPRGAIPTSCLLLPLCAVLAPPLLPVAGAGRVERAPDDVVADAGQVLHAAAPDQHDGVLLQVVADARDVGGDLDPCGQADARDLPESRVRLFGGGRVDANADTAPLGRSPERGSLRLLDQLLAAFPDELLDGGQRCLRIRISDPRRQQPAGRQTITIPPKPLLRPVRRERRGG